MTINSTTSRDRGRCVRRRIAMTVILTVLAGMPSVAQSAMPRVLPPGKLPADARLGPLKDLNGYFPFHVPANVEAWNDRAKRLRQQLLVSQGLWPLPTKTPLNPVIHGRIDQGDYTVEKVFFESMPGFFVTGNLYRPKGKSGRRPGVLCPHGHWANGRFYDCGRQGVLKQIVQGAERFEDGGRSHLQSRCVQLARMGCVVFHWDMIGYADSQQIPQSIIHGFKTQRPEMNRATNWGLFSPQAESHLQSAMGLQSLNSIRALDFLASLPDVDADRIGVTGASGGGTQTFMLSALDPRVRVAFPAVMVSTAMQGGCTCENACCLRVGTGNIEIAALFAPRPLGLSCAKDWTVEMETKGFPELRQLYKLAGAPGNTKLTALTHFGHNYNYVSRAALYSWFNKHLKLGLTEPIVETQYTRLAADQLTVWSAEHPKPKGGPEFERRLLAWWASDAAAQLDALLPTDKPSLAKYREVIGQGVAAILGRSLPDSKRLRLEMAAKQQGRGFALTKGLLTLQLTPREAAGISGNLDLKDAREQLPFVYLRPDSWNGQTCILVFPRGKSGLFDADGAPSSSVRRLLEAGLGVCSVDLLFQGEFLKDGRPVTTTRRVDNPREAAAYTFGYNGSLFARRVHDILSVIAFLKRGEFQSKRILLAGVRGAGPWVAAAQTQAAGQIARLAIDTGGFRFAAVTAIHDPHFLPGGAKYHDLPGMLALAVPTPMFIAGEQGQVPAPVAAAYEAAGQPQRVKLAAASAEESTTALVDWLLQ